MLIQQLSVFLPNQKGHMARVTKILQENGIDLRAVVAFDTSEYGILRLIVSDPEKALAVLLGEGFVAKISKIVAVEPEDRTGSLNELFCLLADNDLNIDYTYCFVIQKKEMPYFALKTNDLEKTAALLHKNGYKVVNLSEICENGGCGL